MNKIEKINDKLIEIESEESEVKDDIMLDSEEYNDDLLQEMEDLSSADESSTPVEVSENALSYYMQRIADNTPISKEEEQELGRRIRNGDKNALDQLISANLKFVIKVANKFKNSNLPMSDIISQGNLGLLEAAKRYDPDKGVKFISYAVWWIRQYIVQGIAEQSSTVKLPIKQAGNLFKINSAKEKMLNELGREASAEELSAYLNMKEEDLTDILRVSRQSLSLETPLKDGEGKTFVECLESNDSSVEDKIMKKNLEKLLSGIMDELDERERKIINLRFGFDDENIMTLDEIGKIFGVSRERIRQLENRAISKLKKKAHKIGLEDYVTC